MWTGSRLLMEQLLMYSRKQNKRPSFTVSSLASSIRNRFPSPGPLPSTPPGPPIAKCHSHSSCILCIHTWMQSTGVGRDNTHECGQGGGRHFKKRKVSLPCMFLSKTSENYTKVSGLHRFLRKIKFNTDNTDV